jgi:cell division septation protein DedD
MRIRYRLMLATVVVLTASLLTAALWPTSAPPPAARVAALPDVPEQAPSAPEPVPERVAARVAAAPVLTSAEARAPAATVVALGPGDVAPEPEVENPPPQQNDAITPELPQTPQWRLEKTTHITALLGRDVERLERELEQAEARGDERRSQQLGTLIQRHRARLHELREELRELGEVVKEASPAE